jgi:hypothetical protein
MDRRAFIIGAIAAVVVIAGEGVTVDIPPP